MIGGESRFVPVRIAFKRRGHDPCVVDQDVELSLSKELFREGVYRGRIEQVRHLRADVWHTANAGIDASDDRRFFPVRSRPAITSAAV
jgi:hypothetical protein